MLALKRSAMGGAGAAGTLGGQAVSTGQGIAGSQLAGGQATAAGTVGASNAAGNFAGNIGQLFALNQLTGGRVFSGMYGQPNQQQPQAA
jgi:hypothetical protein